MRIQLCIIVEPDDRGFHAYSQALPGLHVSGETEDEALENAVEAARAYLESMLKHGDPLPIGSVRPPFDRRLPWQRKARRRECMRDFVLALA